MSKVRFDPQKHHRKSIRLQGFDYSRAGAYFVTLVARQRECIFGQIVNGEMQLNEYGRIVEECWRLTPEHFQNIELGEHVVMPNHLHGIIMITETRRGEVISPHNGGSPLGVKTPFLGGETPPLHKPTLGQIVGYFKYQSTKKNEPA